MREFRLVFFEGTRKGEHRNRVPEVLAGLARNIRPRNDAARSSGGAGWINIGTLSCNVAGGWGLVLGSARPITCTFIAYGGRSERYAGTIWKLGLDLGYTEGGVMIWTVFAPAANLVPGALAGTYAGGTASATVGVGVGANGLIGGSFNSIALQPLSIETNHGLNVSAGLASITLSPS